ncbi:hypothetical protein BDP27DRAFT_1407573 [Rhodocollybia butyracea]|uniref:Uncharacterized protein n=1 Tax=Rhodocollybia butyracea TaxID=206335 RepID=A0A9P5P769_9AGAR|nr:hypothetical protein BDP27DRAFT_1407573 [Rhodocollybia butyracea]
MSWLQNLIQKPYGPYSETLLLNKDTKTLKTRLELNDVYMTSNGEPTGLNETEWVATPPHKLRTVNFIGTFKIEELKWLTPLGYRMLEAALRERDQEENGKADSQVTLEFLYGSAPGKGFKISVYVICKKNQQASYLSKEGHENELVFRSRFHMPKSQPLLWTIRSLDVFTYSLSQNYLEQWRFLRFIQGLTSSYPSESITPRFIALKMIEMCRRDTNHHRYVYDTSVDSDVDAEGNTKLPRRLRHIHKTEVYSIMASYAEWFLAQQLVTGHKKHTYVNLRTWYQFCLKARALKSKRRASKKSVWGQPYTEKTQQTYKHTNIIDLSRFGKVEGGWEDKIERRCLRSPEPDLPDEDFVGEPEPEQIQVDEDHHGRVQYDHDMELSDVPSDDSNDTDWEFDFSPWLLQRPRLMRGATGWGCPDPDCQFSVNILDLRRSNELATKYPFLRQEFELVFTDPRVQELMMLKIGDHYEDHLRQLGIDYEETRGKNSSIKAHLRLRSNGDDASFANVDVGVKGEPGDMNIKDEPGS